MRHAYYAVICCLLFHAIVSMPLLIATRRYERIMLPLRGYYVTYVTLMPLSFRYVADIHISCHDASVAAIDAFARFA